MHYETRIHEHVSNVSHTRSDLIARPSSSGSCHLVFDAVPSGHIEPHLGYMRYRHRLARIIVVVVHIEKVIAIIIIIVLF